MRCGDSPTTTTLTRLEQRLENIMHIPHTVNRREKKSAYDAEHYLFPRGVRHLRIRICIWRRGCECCVRNSKKVDPSSSWLIVASFRPRDVRYMYVDTEPRMYVYIICAGESE